jgi:hypothetical protein
VFYRRIWNIVGKYSILCCDSNDVTDFVAEIAELAITEVMTTELTSKSTNLS